MKKINCNKVVHPDRTRDHLKLAHLRNQIKPLAGQGVTPTLISLTHQLSWHMHMMNVKGTV